MKNVSALLRGPFLMVMWLLLLAGATARAQAPLWLTAMAAGNAATATSKANVYATAADANGSVYVVGSFAGSISLSGISLVSAGGQDVFVAKWNPSSGTFTWAQRAGGPSNDYAQAVAVSGANVYVAGSFRGTAAFGSVSLTSVGSFDGFLAKMYDAGTSSSFGWVQPLGSPNMDEVLALSVVGASVYVSGFFYVSMVLGGTVLTDAGGGDVYVAKFTDAGASSSYVWARRAGGTNHERPTALVVSGASVYVVGYFASTAASFGTTTLPSNGAGSGFVAKLMDAGPTGDFVWARQAASTSSNHIRALAVNGTSLYVGGGFTGTVALGGTVLASAGDYDGFVAKLTDAGLTGDFVWGQRLGGPSPDFLEGVAVSGSNLYLAGSFSATALFGSLGLGSVGGTDVFVAKLADAGAMGAFAWAQRGDGVYDDFPYALTLTTTGTLCVAGLMIPPASFGSLTVTSPFAMQMGFVAALAGNALATSGQSPLADVALFPNPAHTTTTIQLPPILGTATATLTLLDALGRTLRTQTATTNARTELDLTGLLSGLYAVRVTAGSSTATRRLVVE